MFTYLILIIFENRNFNLNINIFVVIFLLLKNIYTYIVNILLFTKSRIIKNYFSKKQLNKQFSELLLKIIDKKYPEFKEKMILLIRLGTVVKTLKKKKIINKIHPDIENFKEISMD